MEDQKAELKSIKAIFRDTFKILSAKKTLWGIIIIPMIPFLIGWWLDDSFPSWQFLPWVFKKICFFISTFFFFLALPAIIYSLKENETLKQSYKRALQIFFPYLWVFFLIIVITLGGFLILIIPGILFFVWFSLAIYVLIFEGKRGMEALRESRNLISGRFWPVFLRFLVFGFLIFLFFNLLFFLLIIFKKEIFIWPLSVLLQFFLPPFALIYGFLIYQDLREKKGIISPPLFPKRELKILFSAILGILVIIPLFFLKCLHFFLDRDIPPFDDNDLKVKKISIPFEENSFFDLVKPVVEVKNWALFEEHLKGNVWDEKFVQETLSQNKEALEKISLAGKKPFFQDPLTEDPANFSPSLVIMPLEQFKNLSKLTSLKALSLIKEEKGKEALDLLFESLEIAQKIQNSQGTIIHYLTGLAMKDVVLEEMRKIIPQIKLSSADLVQYAKELEKFKENEEGFKRAWKGEYTMEKWIFEKNALKELGVEDIWQRQLERNNFYFKPNKTRLYFAENAKIYIKNAEKPCAFWQEEKTPLFIFKPSNWFSLIFTENALGKMLFSLFNVSLSDLVYKKCQEDLSVSVNQILLAIKAYKTDFGIYPFSLNDLVPQYLSFVPPDPFDGKEMRYSLEKRIVYSVGKNLIDEGGSENGDWRKMPDPSFKIDF